MAREITKLLIQIDISWALIAEELLQAIGAPVGAKTYPQSFRVNSSGRISVRLERVEDLRDWRPHEAPPNPLLSGAKPGSSMEALRPKLQPSPDQALPARQSSYVASDGEGKKNVIQEQASEMRERPSSVLRALQPSDFHKGYLQLLEQLTKVGNVSEEDFTSRLEQLQSSEDHYKIVVIEDIDRQLIVATGTVLIELKFLRSCGKVGHIEDIVVDQSTRGQHLGQRVVEYLTRVAKELGCYKVILDCSKENVPFYEKCGFYQKELQMAHYF